MVNGRFRCLGSPQHVKHRHGDGYTLILHLLSGSKPADPAAISAFMDATFPNNVLKVRINWSFNRISLADLKKKTIFVLYGTAHLNGLYPVN